MTATTIPLAIAPAGAPPATLAGLLRWVAPLIAGRRVLLARIALLSCLSSLLALAQPWLAKVLVDDGALAGDLRVLAGTCLLMLLMPLVGLALEAGTRFDYLALSSQVLFGLRERVFAHLQRLSPGYYARVGYGDLVARFDGDLAEVQRFAVDGPLAVANGLFNLVALVVLLSLLSPALALVALVTVPVQLALTLRHRRRIEGDTGEVRRQATLLSGYFLDSLRNVKLIQSSNNEAARLDGLKTRHGAYYAALRAVQQSGFVLSATQRVAGLCGTALVFGVGGYLLATQQISVGVLLAFVIYAARAGAPVQTLLGVLSGWQRTRVSLARLAEVLGAGGAAEHGKGEGGHLPTPVRGEIRLEGVRFSHDDARVVLQEADLHLPAGSKTVIVGTSGGGKSTLADLLLGHLQPDAGTLRVDGVDLSTVALAELRRHVAVVDQEPLFFPGTVADNLRLVAPQASDDELRAALRDAGLLPAEVDLATAVGAASAALSRGQRMRLALARALLQRPAVLVLDETISAVDHAMERRLLATVDRRFGHCTRILITHHPLAAGKADACYCLDRGRFVPIQPPAVADAG
ncbi:MAG: ABC transporter ATP-binding protein [Rhodocyclales bacterium]|nr:ABC transporter ATP-binding protein [Rhodocyclales bacterium]